MGSIMLRAALFGAAGLLAVPVAVFFGVLLVAHAAGGCGAGDAGGCEMGAASLALAATIPAFAIFFVVTLIRGLSRRRKQLARDRAAI